MNIHGRGIERKMPTGMAWHGATLKAIYEAIGANFFILETDLNNRCNADNQLLIEGLEYWEKALGLPGTGTLAERQAAVLQRLGDSGGITVAAITEALHRAGFTNLFAHPNYEYLPLTTVATPMGANTLMGAGTQMSYAHIYTNVVDPAIFENFAPYETMGLSTQMGADTQMGAGSGAEGIVVNNLQDDSFAQIPANPATWTGVFFVCGENKFEVAPVLLTQKEVLKLLIQTVKPFNAAAILLVESYVLGGIQINSPTAFSRIFVGDSFTVSGISNFADGTQVTLVIVYPDSTEEPYDVTTITGGEFSFGEITLSDDYGTGYATLKVNAEHASEEVLIQLALHSLAITSPASSAEIVIGSDVMITGTTDFADGETVAIYKSVNDTDTQIGSAVVINGGFSYTWTAAGDPGTITLRAVCGNIEDSVDITLTATIVVIEPVENQSVLADTPFSVEVESEAVGNVLVYAGSTLIATIPISGGVAEGTATIPDSLAGVGSAFIVDGGGETPAGGPQTIPLRFTDASGEATVNVKVALGEHFVIGTAIGTMGFTADRTINGEFALEAEGSVSVTDSE